MTGRRACVAATSCAPILGCWPGGDWTDVELRERLGALLTTRGGPLRSGPPVGSPSRGSLGWRVDARDALCSTGRRPGRDSVGRGADRACGGKAAPAARLL